MVGRREVVSASAVIALGSTTGCGAPSSRSTKRLRGTSAPTTSSQSDPDVALVRSALRDETQVLGYLISLRTSHPGLRGRVRSLVGIQRRHVSALRSALAHPPARHAPPHRHVPARRKAALAEMDRLIAQLGTDRRNDALSAASGAVAALLASISASHAASLTKPIGAE